MKIFININECSLIPLILRLVKVVIIAMIFILTAKIKSHFVMSNKAGQAR